MSKPSPFGLNPSTGSGRTEVRVSYYTFNSYSGNKYAGYSHIYFLNMALHPAHNISRTHGPWLTRYFSAIHEQCQRGDAADVEVRA